MPPVGDDDDLKLFNWKRVFTISRGYMHTISKMPATAPAVNCHGKGNGRDVSTAVVFEVRSVMLTDSTITKSTDLRLRRS
jgi:hypothetical protein